MFDDASADAHLERDQRGGLAQAVRSPPPDEADDAEPELPADADEPEPDASEEPDDGKPPDELVDVDPDVYPRPFTTRPCVGASLFTLTTGPE